MRKFSVFPLASLLAIWTVAAGTAFAQEAVPAPVATQQQPADSNTSPAAPQSQAAPKPGVKPAKVWDNDEINALSNNHSVSVVGKSGSRKASLTSNKTKGYSQEKDAAWYRQQLMPLRADIDKLDPQIARLKAFLSGDNISDPTTAHLKMVPTPTEQLHQMETKRQADADKIEDLMDRARHNGIEPGALR